MDSQSTHKGCQPLIRLNEHKLSEFIYGTVTGIVAVAGIQAGENISGLGAITVILVGAVAIWVAHAYSVLMSHRLASGEPSSFKDLAKALQGSWPVVIAGALLAIPFLFVELNLWTIGTAVTVSSAMGVLFLTLIGILAGIVTKETWPRRILTIALSTGFGLAVVAVELYAHGH